MSAIDVVLLVSAMGAAGCAGYVPPSATELYRECAAGSVDKCFWLGTRLEHGNNVTGAVEMFSLGCQAHGRSSCERLIALAERFSTASPSSATSALQTACDAGSGKACYRLGSLGLESDRFKLTDERLVWLFGRACDLDYPDGYDGLGNLYKSGIGVTRLGKRAFQLFHEACNKESARGCNDLAIAYAEGQVVEQDDAIAARLFDKACEEVPSACENLGALADRSPEAANRLEARARREQEAEEARAAAEERDARREEREARDREEATEQARQDRIDSAASFNRALAGASRQLQQLNNQTQANARASRAIGRDTSHPRAAGGLSSARSGRAADRRLRPALAPSAAGDAAFRSSVEPRRGTNSSSNDVATGRQGGPFVTFRAAPLPEAPHGPHIPDLPLRRRANRQAHDLQFDISWIEDEREKGNTWAKVADGIRHRITGPSLYQWRDFESQLRPWYTWYESVPRDFQRNCPSPPRTGYGAVASVCPETIMDWAPCLESIRKLMAELDAVDAVEMCIIRQIPAIRGGGGG